MSKREERLYSWEITKLPGDGEEGCNANVAVFHSVWVNSLARGLGIGQAQHLERLRVAKAQGYTYALCTVRTDNPVQIHILTKNGWERLKVFAGHDGDVYLYGKEL